MSFKVDGKEILKEVEKEKGDRTKVSLYLSKSLYDEFKKQCRAAPASQVMEKLMRAFLDSLKGSK